MGSIEILTAVLVVITAFYAWQNYRMANEMRAAREVTVLPKLALSLGMVGPQHGFIYLANVGPGAALDVDITIEFIPHDNEPDKHVARRWATSVMTSGETHHFFPEDRGADVKAGEGEILGIDALIATYLEIRLSGSYRDALGNAHTAKDVLADLAEWWSVQTFSGVAWAHPDPDYRFASTLGDGLKQKFAQHNRTMESELKGIRRAIAAIKQADEPDKT